MVQDVGFLSRIYAEDIATGREQVDFTRGISSLGSQGSHHTPGRFNKIAETLGSLLQPSRELIAPLRSACTNLCTRYLRRKISKPTLRWPW